MTGLFNTKYFKVFFILVLLSIIATVFILDYLKDWTAENPALVKSSISFVNQYGFIGMFIIAFLGGTLIPVPIEPILGAVAVLGGNKAILFLIATILGHTLGCIISFYLARLLREPFVYKRVSKEAIKSFHDFWKKHGDITLFITALIPVLPGDIVAFVAGLSKMSAKRFVIIMLSAKTIIYILIVFFSFKIAETWFIGII